MNDQTLPQTTDQVPNRAQEPPRILVLGHIGAVHGVRGWVRVHSETDPIENVLRYRPWHLRGPGLANRTLEPAEGRRHGKALVVRFAGYDDRDKSAVLVGAEIAIPRTQLPPPRADEFYWCDLEGLTVATQAGVDLGRVDHLFATGANDVICVKGERERLLPFVWGDVIKDVDFAGGRILVDWDPDF
jgi:16S rRNA processing protein RimM